MTTQFSDRAEAGRLLAKQLKPNYGHCPDLLVLGLPRGGVPVAYEIATGSTLKAALSTIKQQQPKRIIIAIPVAPPDVYNELKAEVDEIVCLFIPKWLYAIGLWYNDFSPTSDEEVCNLLAQNIHKPKVTL